MGFQKRRPLGKEGLDAYITSLIKSSNDADRVDGYILYFLVADYKRSLQTDETYLAEQKKMFSGMVDFLIGNIDKVAGGDNTYECYSALAFLLGQNCNCGGKYSYSAEAEPKILELILKLLANNTQIDAKYLTRDYLLYLSNFKDRDKIAFSVYKDPKKKIASFFEYDFPTGKLTEIIPDFDIGKFRISSCSQSSFIYSIPYQKAPSVSENITESKLRILDLPNSWSSPGTKNIKNNFFYFGYSSFEPIFFFSKKAVCD